MWTNFDQNLHPTKRDHRVYLACPQQSFHCILCSLFTGWYRQNTELDTASLLISVYYLQRGLCTTKRCDLARNIQNICFVTRNSNGYYVCCRRIALINSNALRLAISSSMSPSSSLILRQSLIYSSLVSAIPNIKLTTQPK